MPAFNQDPISRSRGVRSSARAHLARLREDRLQKRMAASPAAPATPSHAAVCDPDPSPMVSAPSSTAAIPQDTRSDAPRASAPPIGDSEDMALTIEGCGAGPDEHRSSHVDEDTVDDVPTTEPIASLATTPSPLAVETAPGSPGPSPAPEALPGPSATAATCHPGNQPSIEHDDPPADSLSFPKDTSSDLVDLPGAGPGLVWLLQECGVTSMAELAIADATDLSGKLGIVGQLLDLEHWIAHARANS